MSFVTANNNYIRWSHLAWGIGGVLAGTWLARKKLAQTQKSRAERDYPDIAEIVYEEIAELLDKWRPGQDCKTENDFVEDLADYLEDGTELDFEVSPDTEVGKPDILIENMLALELKVRPNKSEQDRCIGQCADYSRLWITCMVIIDSKPSDIGRLERVLKDKGLEQIEVWGFS